jgi:hypothetical protein
LGDSNPTAPFWSILTWATESRRLRAMSTFNTLAARSLEIAKTYLYGRVVDA